MAGDWLKMEKCTPDKPEMFQLAVHLNVPLSVPFLSCFRLWSWADSQTEDGILRVPKEAIDAVAQLPNFHLALCAVGWLKIEENGMVELPNFLRHMGFAAKKRLKEAEKKRRQRSRSGPSPCPPSCPPICPETNGTDRGTREEKRRVYKPPLKSPPGGDFSEHRSRRPKKARPTEEELLSACQRGIDESEKRRQGLLGGNHHVDG